MIWVNLLWCLNYFVGRVCGWHQPKVGDLQVRLYKMYLAATDGKRPARWSL